MLIDSTFLHDLIREDGDAVAELDDLIHNSTPVALSPLTIYEVGIGLRGDASTLQSRFQDTIRLIDTAPLGDKQAQHALAILRGLMDRGERIGAVDVLLAGTAATLDNPRVLTRNVDEFERVEIIDVETY
jgi:predicted nucleic acid-binding protein